ncbi:MAG TPA: cupin domain-containing protein [Chryseolinea sp.]|nr:cupin domain-containing protein [Chryseolinea sp.]
MEAGEVEKSKKFNLVDVLDYAPNAILSKTILKKATGNVTALSFSAGEVLKAKILPFDTLLQVLEGEAEVIIDGKSLTLGIGQSIVIPSHTQNTIKAIVRFKMVSTVIKAGYEDVM